MSFYDIVAPLFDNIEALFTNEIFTTYDELPQWKGDEFEALASRVKFGNWLPISLMLVPISLVNKELNKCVDKTWQFYPFLCIKPALRVARRFGERPYYSSFAIMRLLWNFSEYPIHLNECAALLGQTASYCGSIAIAKGAILQAMTTFWAESSDYCCDASAWTKRLSILNDVLLDIGVFCPNIVDLDLGLCAKEVDTQDTLEQEVLTDELQKRVFALAAVTSGCKKIKKLAIGGWLIRHHATRGIEYITQNCEFLQEFNMDYCELTKHSIQLLHEGMPNLQSIEMTEGPELSADQWNDFLKARYDLGLRMFYSENTLIPKATTQFAIEHLPRLCMHGYYCESDDDFDD